MKKSYVIAIVLVLCTGVYFVLYSTFFLKIFFDEKMWVHRTNSIEKLNEVKNDFYGVELDVEYLDSLDRFDVNHPPVISIGLSLNKYLGSGSENKNLHYWFDFKNLNTNNQQKSLKKILSICSNYHVNPSNIIVENGDLSLLVGFQQKGFLVSYYLNWPGLYTLSDTEFDSELKKIRTSLAINKFPCFISSDYRDYEILKRYFPNNEKLLWLDDNFSQTKSIKNRLKLIKMLNDEKVKVMLVKHKSISNER